MKKSYFLIPFLLLSLTSCGFKHQTIQDMGTANDDFNHEFCPYAVFEGHYRQVIELFDLKKDDFPTGYDELIIVNNISADEKGEIIGHRRVYEGKSITTYERTVNDDTTQFIVYGDIDKDKKEAKIGLEMYDGKNVSKYYTKTTFTDEDYGDLGELYAETSLTYYEFSKLYLELINDISGVGVTADNPNGIIYDYTKGTYSYGLTKENMVRYGCTLGSGVDYYVFIDSDQRFRTFEMFDTSDKKSTTLSSLSLLPNSTAVELPSFNKFDFVTETKLLELYTGFFA